MAEELRLIKKYPNRRLYDTATSSYITLADVKTLVLEQVQFKVLDAKTGDDLTRAILLHRLLPLYRKIKVQPRRVSRRGFFCLAGSGGISPRAVRGANRARAPDRHQYMCWPPLIEMFAPVRNAASSDAR